MATSTKFYDMTGNQIQMDGACITWDSMTNVAIPSATQPCVVAGTGAPTFSAKKGTLYLRLDGSTTNDRAYINTNGATTWTAITTAA